MLLCRYRQFLEPFTMLLMEGSYKGNFLQMSLTRFLQSLISEIHKLWGSSFLKKKCSKFDIHFKNTEKNWQKGFCFLDNCIWFGWDKFSLLRRECLSLVVNVLTNSPQILHVTKRDFFSNSISFILIKEYGKNVLVQILRVCGTD